MIQGCLHLPPVQGHDPEEGQHGGGGPGVGPVNPPTAHPAQHGQPGPARARYHQQQSQ